MRVWLRWAGEWFLYLLWWLGYFIALCLLFFIAIAFILPRSAPRLTSVIVALLASLVVTAWQLRRSLHSKPESTGGREEAGVNETWRQDSMSPFIGLFCGPILSAFASAGISSLYRRFGYYPREEEAFLTILLSGAWLGAFTWEVIGVSRHRRATAGFLLIGGLTAAIGLLASAVWLSRGENVIVELAGTLAALTAPILWSATLIVSALAIFIRRPHPLERLIEAESIEFTAQLYIGLPEEHEIAGRMLKGNRLSVRAVRPAWLRIDVLDTKDDFTDEPEIALIPCDRFVSNGKRQCEVLEVTGEYVEDEAASWISHITSRRGLPEAVSVDVLFYEEPLYYFKEIGPEVHEGRAVKVYDRKYGDEQVRQRLYIDEKLGLPARISMILFGEEMRITEIMRADFKDWNLNAVMKAELFDPTPPKGMNPVGPEPAWYDESIQPGTNPAPFEAPDLEGRSVRLSDYLGKVVLLDFWAVWCGPCTAEIPSIQAVYAKHRNRGFEVIGISFDDTAGLDRLRDFIRDRRIEWPVICDGCGFRTLLAEPYGINAVPFTLLIGRDGKIAEVNLHGEALIQAIDMLVSK